MMGLHCTDYAKNRRNIVYVDFLLYLRPATLRGNPSKVRSQYPATDNHFVKTTKLCKHISFFCRNICTIDFFVVPLHKILEI